MTRISPSREATFQVLREVEAGAYASDRLRERTAGLTSRDAGLASEMVFGSLRFQKQLDFLIEYFSGRKPDTLDNPIRTVLRMTIYQLRYLDRIPAHAAVHEAVELAKREKRSAAGLVNAVLRKLNDDPAPWPNEAVALSCPEWLLSRWKEHFGSDSARAIARAALERPAHYLRFEPGSSLPPDLRLEETSVSGAYRLLSPLPPGARLHDISSQAIIPLLELEPGMSMLDLCAAPGNKTLQAAETPLRLLIACDISAKRLRDVPPVSVRVALDASVRLPFRSKFDRVFIDAPCSGTGTLGRNPEIKWRVKVEDFARFHVRQKEILTQGVTALKPAGKLVYATCSLEREENEAVVESVLAETRGLSCESQLWRLPGRDEGDGFFAARFVWRPTKASLGQVTAP